LWISGLFSSLSSQIFPICATLLLLKGEKPTDDIYDKAESWAKFRINKGMSPFASSTGNEKVPAPEASNKFAEGGMASNDMNRLFAEGGMNDEGGTVDPVSGNDVPPGSLQNEVRDDIDAKLSEGEFVVPADVVRYIGLERLMKLRDEAKAGLARMNEIGQMGNAEEVENPEALHSGEDEGFDSEIDDIMQEVEGEAMGEPKFAKGGIVSVPSADKDILAKYNIPRTSITNPALDVF
jgi:Arc/MetJ-type ribon-helix-helix transcriptional regulator